MCFAGRGEVTPKRLRIYANHPHIVDFSEAETSQPHLNISLLEGQVPVTEYPLRAAAFANINAVSVHFVCNLARFISVVHSQSLV